MKWGETDGIIKYKRFYDGVDSMLIFSTTLDINESLTREAFVRLAIEWNQGSPHSSNVIRDIAWNGEKSARYENERCWMEIVEYQEITAIRYELTDDNGAVWDTDFVMNFGEMRMSIQLSRSFRDDALEVGADFVAPHFVTLLIENGYVKADGVLPVARIPLTAPSVSIIPMPLWAIVFISTTVRRALMSCFTARWSEM